MGAQRLHSSVWFVQFSTFVCSFLVLAVALSVSTDAAQPGMDDQNCSDFPKQDAQGHLRVDPNDPDNLDGDNGGIVCEGLSCPCDFTPVGQPTLTHSETPTPTPSKTPTPTHIAAPVGQAPTPTPVPGRVLPGDVDCTSDVTAVDALQILRYVASLPSSANCLQSAGDVNCDGVIDSVDALMILRHVAGLPVNLPDDCPVMGSYDMSVLVIKYFPLTADGKNIDIAITGDVGEPYPLIRQRTIDITDTLAVSLGRATSYLGYKDPNAQPALRYLVVDTQEHTEAFPLKPGTTATPDYGRVLLEHDICDYVNMQGVQEVWAFAYQGPGPQLAISESKMSGPFGDISNSYRLNDMPLCAHTYRVYTFNYGRGTAEALESWGHQMEAELDAVNHDFFRNIFQGPNYPEKLGVPGRCGSVHNPPNAEFEYNRDNGVQHESDCLDWSPDGLGSLSLISCENWGCDYSSDADNPPLNYMVWNWQNLPGRGNAKTYQGQRLRNFWDIHGNFDGIMSSDRTIFVTSGSVGASQLLFVDEADPW